MNSQSIFSLLLISIILNCCVTDTKEPTDGYFQGKVRYSYSYETDLLNLDSLTRVRPAKSEFRFDQSNYQSIFFGQDTLAYYYLSDLNKCLSRKNGVDQDCEDYSVNTDTILHFKVYDIEEKVLGHRSRVIEYQGKYFWNKYVVSRDLRLAPETYQKHQAYNWSFYGDQTGGGLILQLEHRFENYTMKGLAVDIQQRHGGGYKALEINEDHILHYCENE